MPPVENLADWFGNIDIYLFDQILRGRIRPDMKILDAGCGGGRNDVFFLRTRHDVHGVDSDADAVERTRALAMRLGFTDAELRFRVAQIQHLPYGGEEFDVVLCNAVLHLAPDEETFMAMLRDLWRVLKPGGVFFARLASRDGLERLARLVEGRRYVIPDGSERFLVDQTYLRELTEALGADFLDSIKTVNVQNERCMATWVLRKRV